MPDDANSVSIYLTTGCKEAHRGLCVVGEIEASAGRVAACRLSDASLVVANSCDTMTREVIGDEQERLPSTTAAVPIMRARAADQHDSGKRSSPVRYGERATQSDTGFCVDRDILHAIRKWRPRLLSAYTRSCLLYTSDAADE